MKTTSFPSKAPSLDRKVNFLRQPASYPGVTHVETLETHMSWVFLADQYVYKLKKPVRYDFLDFTTPEARQKYCTEEVRINKPLAGDTYRGVVQLKIADGAMQLNGAGETIDWLVKMKRLPEQHMLHTAISNGTVRSDLVKQAADLLADFYLSSIPVKLNPKQFRQQIVKDIERNSDELLRPEFTLARSAIIDITTDLLYFIAMYADLFDQRVAEGRIIEGHGDLRPEHICLAPKPVIIDRVEFNSALRIMDVAEELSLLALECEMLNATATGQLFLSTYKSKSGDEIPDMLISFYKAKRALLRAKLSIHHLLEKKYLANEQKWKGRCEGYMRAANAYCDQLPTRAA